MGDNSKIRNVAVFCGGRGSSSLIRELIKRENIKLTLLINAYDDGLSTGELRRLVPGLLGPSDIRKNVSYLIDLYSDSQYALLDFFNYRIPKDIKPEQEPFIIKFFKEGITDNEKNKYIPSSMTSICDRLEKKVRVQLFNYISYFFEYMRRTKTKYELADFSIGNLIYAGIFIATGKDNNKTIDVFSDLFVLNKDVDVLNVTSGENLVLVGLKKDGEFLERESAIVSEQSSVPIARLFLLEKYLTAAQCKKLDDMEFDQKLKYLASLSVAPKISSGAKKAIKDADIIIYGPGTQHSSLLPSYLTKGVPEAIAANKHAKKLLVINILEDYDIQGLTAHDLVDNVLYYMGGNNKNSEYITHALYTKTLSPQRIKLRNEELIPNYGEAAWVVDTFERYADAGIHMGSKLIDKVIEISDDAIQATKPKVDIMLSFHKRTKAIPDIISELKDLNWSNEFSEITLHLQELSGNIQKLPPKVNIKTHPDEEIETDAFKTWLNTEDSAYFIALTGDGVYRMRDVFNAIHFLSLSDFSAILGSRNQDKKQMLKSVNYAYGNSKLWYFLGNLAFYINTTIYMMKYQKVFSDPLTGFRVYKKAAFSDSKKLLRKKKISQFSIMAFLLKNGANVAELPIFYRTYSGFTDKSWRLKTAIKSTLSILFGK